MRLPPMLALLAGTVMISFSAVFVRLVDVEPTASAAYRMGLGGLVLAVVVLVRGGRLWNGTRPALVALMGAFFFALDLWFWHRSILYVGPGLATLLANFQVFALAIIGVLVFRERGGWKFWLALPLGFGGLVLLVAGDWTALGEDYRLGVLLGLATAVAYAAYLLALRLARVGAASSGTSTADMTQLSLACALMLALAAAAGGERLWPVAPVDLGWLLIYGIAAQVLGWVLISTSLAKLPASRVGLVLLLQPTLAFIWDVWFFDRGFTAIEAAGAAITLAAIYLGAQRVNRPPETVSD